MLAAPLGKHRISAVLIVVAAVLLTFQAIPRISVHAQAGPAVVPFAGGISYQYATGGTFPVFGRQADNTYTIFQFGGKSPYPLLSTMSAFMKWLNGGLKSLLSTPPGPAGVGRESQKYSTADLDGNGTLGVAVARGGSVAVYYGNGGLTPYTVQANALGTEANSVILADFNNDGKADLAVACGAGTQPGMAILLNRGNNTFQSPLVFGAGIAATRFAVFDLNHDNILDIAAVTTAGISVFIGKGDGTFNSPIQYPITGNGYGITIADFDGDGNPDIAVGGNIGILLGSGNGTFHNGKLLPPGAGTNQVWAYAAGDLNGDGKMDLVYEDIANQLVVPMYGGGNGTFQPGHAYTVSSLPDSIVLADYNNDGHLDIINGSGDARLFGPSAQSYDVDILLSNGDGTFQGAAAYLPPISASFTHEVGFATEAPVAVAKFGGQSYGVLTAGPSGFVELYAGDGKGGLQTPQNYPINGIAGQIAAADFNGDGKPDAAVIDYAVGGGTISLLLANSTGFAGATSILPGGRYPTAIVSADFDGDGKPDLVVLSSASGTGVTNNPGTMSFLKGNGDGTFAPSVITPAGLFPLFASAVDVNGDGKLDLVFSDAGSSGQGGGVYVSLNAGNGALGTPVKVFSGIYPAFGVADVNGDHVPDLVASSLFTLSWSAGKGDGTFQAPAVITTSNAPETYILLQDFNGDGKADIVLAQQSGNTAFLSGNGDGTFSAETPFIATQAASYLQSADLNGDGKPDLVAAGTTLTTLLNNSVLPVTTVNSASYAAGSVAVGSIATLFGSGLATSIGQTGATLGTQLANTTVTLTDATGTAQPCSLFYVSPSQINFLIPPSASPGIASLVVQNGGTTVGVGAASLSNTAPGIYTAGANLANALLLRADSAGHQTTSVLLSANASGQIVTTPISLDPPTDQVYLILYGTGIRGASLSQVSVQVGTLKLNPAYAGAAPGYPGEDQVNLLLPYSLKGSGDTSLTLTVAGQTSNTVHIQIQ